MDRKGKKEMLKEKELLEELKNHDTP